MGGSNLPTVACRQLPSQETSCTYIALIGVLNSLTKFTLQSDEIDYVVGASLLYQPLYHNQPMIQFCSFVGSCKSYSFSALRARFAREI